MIDEIRDKDLPPWAMKLLKPFVFQKVHTGFLIFGLLVSLGLFMAVQSFTDSVLSDDYERISRETSETVAKEFSELEFSLRTVSTLLALSDEGDSQKILRKLATVEDSLISYETIFWLRKVEGEWVMLELYSNLFGGTLIDYSDILKHEAVQLAMRNALQKKDQLSLVSNLEFGQNPKTLKAQDGSNYFALVKAGEMVGGVESVVVGISNLGHVFETRTLNVDERISDIRVRDVQGDYSLFGYSRDKGASNKEYEAWKSFDVLVGGRTLEINSRFFKREDMLLLEILSFVVFGFSIILTLTITLYLRSNRQQTMKFSDINERLTEKNMALLAEVKKREQLNQSARRADKENRVIIDSVSDIILETDIEGKIVFLNAQWPKITGFEVEQSMGLELFSVLHPRDQHDVQNEFELLMRGKNKSFRKYTRLRTSDGTFRAAELSVSMINQDDEDLRRVVGTLTDVEERRRAERALSEAERKYRNIVQNAAGGIFQLTPEGLYLSANPAMAEVLGYETPEQVLREVKNASIDVYVDAQSRASFIREVEKNEIVTNHETLVKRRDGSEVWVNENIHTVRDEGGGILYFEGSIEDISARKRSALALQDAKVHSDLANRAKSEFLANMSHELRTPLNSIIGFSEIIREEVMGKIEQREYWEYARDINESGKNLLNVINEILDISKIEAGERELKEAQVKVDQVAASCVELLSAKIANNDITITNNLAGMPELICEELSVKQVLMNLLSNAVKFTPKSGRVSLSYEVDREDRLHVSVTDTGIGLDDDEIHKALSPFGQVNSDLNREGSGTGLGLTLVDALLKIHGAELGLVSQKGIGTTATAIFPKDRVVAKKDKVAVAEDPIEDIDGQADVF